MKTIELYDIITLDNDEEYTVIKIFNENGKKYYLIAPVDDEEEPDVENIKIVKALEKNGEIEIEEIEDEKLLKRLAKEFFNSLREGLE